LDATYYVFFPGGANDPVRRHIQEELGWNRHLVEPEVRSFLDDLAASPDAALKPDKPKRRTPRPPTEPRELTKKQAEAVQVVGECKGSIADAARRLARDPKTVRQHYNAAMEKMGRKVVKAATKPTPTDRRGQEKLADGDDRRRI
jgi:hypothetical protein